MKRELRGVLALGLVLSFQGGFALAVMAFDRNNRALPSNIGYVAVVEALAMAFILGFYALRQKRLGRELAEASLSPLEARFPEASGPSDGLWRDFCAELRRAAQEDASRREAEAREELEAFLETVHALKTPATALSLMAENAEKEGRPMSAKDLRLEIDELDRILDRAVGRLRLGDFEQGSRMEKVRVEEAARASIRKHRRILISRKIAVEVEGSFTAETDPYWLSFILDQLVSNAAKYASSRVSIRLSPDQGERRGRIEVEDDGPGLDEEDLLRAFGRSARGSAGSAAGERGPASSGYGLYLASQAAARLGSKLAIGNDGGARLSFSLPLALDPRVDLTES